MHLSAHLNGTPPVTRLGLLVRRRRSATGSRLASPSRLPALIGTVVSSGSNLFESEQLAIEQSAAHNDAAHLSQSENCTLPPADKHLSGWLNLNWRSNATYNITDSTLTCVEETICLSRKSRKLLRVCDDATHQQAFRHLGLFFKCSSSLIPVI